MARSSNYPAAIKKCRFTVIFLQHLSVWSRLLKERSERWPSGLRQRFAKPSCGYTPAPRVRIPPSPLDFQKWTILLQLQYTSQSLRNQEWWITSFNCWLLTDRFQIYTKIYYLSGEKFYWNGILYLDLTRGVSNYFSRLFFHADSGFLA